MLIFCVFGLIRVNCWCSVEKLDVELIKGQAGVKLLHGPRISAYGATEVYVLDVAGHLHEFAETPDWKDN